MKIITGFITNWRIASKTAVIRAKPIVNLLGDKDVASKFLIETLEGREKISLDAMFCIGAAADAWQQMPKKLLAKYEVTAIENGWLVCTPRPHNAVNCIEVTQEWLQHGDDNRFVDYPDDRMENMGRFAIEGQWGDDKYPSLGKKIQWGDTGDFICQNRTDPSDVWVVRRNLFLNTYVFKS